MSFYLVCGFLTLNKIQFIISFSMKIDAPAAEWILKISLFLSRKTFKYSLHQYVP